MNKQEKLLYYLALTLVIISVGLRISHVVDSASSHLLMSLGFSLGFIAYGRYARRLKAHNEQLEQEVHALRSAQI